MENFIINNGVLKQYIGQDKVVFIPDNVITIGFKAFCDCNTVEEVVISKNTKSIEIFAFDNCKALRKVVLTSASTNGWLCAFNNCENLEFNKYDNGYYLGTDKNPFFCFYKEINNELPNCKIHKDTIILSYFSNKFKIDVESKYFKVIDNVVYSFDGKRLYHCHTYKRGEFDIPFGVESIEEFAFRYCRYLTDIKIPRTVKIIKGWAFNECIEIEKIYIPNSVEEVGYRIFNGCPGVKVLIEHSKKPPKWNNYWDELDEEYLVNWFSPVNSIWGVKEKNIIRADRFLNLEIIKNYLIDKFAKEKNERQRYVLAELYRRAEYVQDNMNNVKLNHQSSSRTSNKSLVFDILANLREMREIELIEKLCNLNYVKEKFGITSNPILVEEKRGLFGLEPSNFYKNDLFEFDGVYYYVTNRWTKKSLQLFYDWAIKE